MKFSKLIIALTIASNVTAIRADVHLARVFGSHMVLQREMPVPIWGWADPGEQVNINLAGREEKVTTTADGRWRVTFPPMPAGGPFELTATGKNTITLTDILFGEVWLCSGQSNMEYGVGLLKNGATVIAAANHPQIRLFAASHTFAGSPQSDLKDEREIDPDYEVSLLGRGKSNYGGSVELQTLREKNANQWRACTPQTISMVGWGGFPAAAYVFAVDLQKKLNVPIGLIHAAYGGARIESFIPIEGLEFVPEHEKAANNFRLHNHDYYKAYGAWLTEVEKQMPQAREALSKGETPIFPPVPKHALRKSYDPTVIYNAMIHPLVPMAMRGVLWHQGESNVGTKAYAPGQKLWYYEQMKELIGGWRKVWGQGDFPFYFCEQGPFRQWEKDGLPEHWTAQLAAALFIPNSGVVVTTDIGEPWDLHPFDKESVGHRYALWALAKTYGFKDIVYSGPLYQSMTVEGNRIRIQFDSIGSGLAARDGKALTHFEIAGANHQYLPAVAKIDGASILVENDSIAHPAEARFAWTWTHPPAPAPLTPPNLINTEGLPAAPFQTEALSHINAEISAKRFKM